MTVRMGKKFAELSADVTRGADPRGLARAIADGATPGCYPVALVLNFAAQGLAAR